MKNLTKFFLIVVFLGFSMGANAQAKIKLGHIDSNELLKIMPGRDSAVAKITDYQKTLEGQLKGMQAELQSKYQEYMSQKETLTPLIRQVKETELQDMQSRIDAFSESADSDMQKKQTELLKPLVDKAKAAIEKVAKENQFTYIFDAGIGVLLYSDNSQDIMPLVKKELGIN